MAQLAELQKSRAKGKADEHLISEISRLESAITVTKDDLVGVALASVVLVTDIIPLPPCRAPAS